MSRRSYRQYCALARGLDVIGDRWVLPIVRNLLLGPQTWSELRDALPGIATNLLSERLKLMIADDIIQQVDDTYALTARGQELETVVFAIANWGERHFMGPPNQEDEFRLRYLMTSIRRKLKPCRRHARLQLWIDQSAFHIELGPQPSVTQGTAKADATARFGLRGFRALLFGGASVQGLYKDKLFDLNGDLAIVKQFQQALA